MWRKLPRLLCKKQYAGGGAKICCYFLSLRHRSVVNARLDIQYRYDDLFAVRPRRAKKNRPRIELAFVEPRNKEYYWNIFRKYHYLSNHFQKSARTFLTFANGRLCGFISYIYFMHPGKEKFWQAHRVVVFPDYQGVGIGRAQMDYTAKALKKEGKTAIITTSSASMIMALKKSPKWACRHFGRSSNGSRTGKIQNIGIKGSTSSARITASFRYIGD